MAATELVLECSSETEQKSPSSTNDQSLILTEESPAPALPLELSSIEDTPTPTPTSSASQQISCTPTTATVTGTVADDQEYPTSSQNDTSNTPQKENSNTPQNDPSNTPQKEISNTPQNDPSNTPQKEISNTPQNDTKESNAPETETSNTPHTSQPSQTDYPPSQAPEKCHDFDENTNAPNVCQQVEIVTVETNRDEHVSIPRIDAVWSIGQEHSYIGQDHSYDHKPGKAADWADSQRHHSVVRPKLVRIPHTGTATIPQCVDTQHSRTVFPKNPGQETHKAHIVSMSQIMKTQRKSSKTFFIQDSPEPSKKSDSLTEYRSKPFAMSKSYKTLKVLTLPSHSLSGGKSCLIDHNLKPLQIQHNLEHKKSLAVLKLETLRFNYQEDSDESRHLPFVSDLAPSSPNPYCGKKFKKTVKGVASRSKYRHREEVGMDAVYLDVDDDPQSPGFMSSMHEDSMEDDSLDQSGQSLSMDQYLPDFADLPPFPNIPFDPPEDQYAETNYLTPSIQHSVLDYDWPPADSCFPPGSSKTGPISMATGPISMATGPISMATGPISMATAPISMTTGPISLPAGPISMTTISKPLSCQMLNTDRLTARNQFLDNQPPPDNSQFEENGQCGKCVHKESDSDQHTDTSEHGNQSELLSRANKEKETISEETNSEENENIVNDASPIADPLSNSPAKDSALEIVTPSLSANHDTAALFGLPSPSYSSTQVAAASFNDRVKDGGGSEDKMDVQDTEQDDVVSSGTTIPVTSSADFIMADIKTEENPWYGTGSHHNTKSFVSPSPMTTGDTILAPCPDSDNVGHDGAISTALMTALDLDPQHAAFMDNHRPGGLFSAMENHGGLEYQRPDGVESQSGVEFQRLSGFETQVGMDMARASSMDSQPAYTLASQPYRDHTYPGHATVVSSQPTFSDSGSLGVGCSSSFLSPPPSVETQVSQRSTPCLDESGYMTLEEPDLQASTGLYWSHPHQHHFPPPDNVCNEGEVYQPGGYGEGGGCGEGGWYPYTHQDSHYQTLHQTASSATATSSSEVIYYPFNDLMQLNPSLLGSEENMSIQYVHPHSYPHPYPQQVPEQCPDPTLSQVYFPQSGRKRGRGGRPRGGRHFHSQIQSDHITSSLHRQLQSQMGTPVKRQYRRRNPDARRKSATPKPPRELLEVGEKKVRHNEPLNQRAVDIMYEWYWQHEDNPYPSKEEKEMMALEGGITTMQVKSWFANKRNRSNNTRPKVQKRAMEEKLMQIYNKLSSTDSASVQEGGNSFIIKELSQIIHNKLDTEMPGTPDSVM